MNFPTAATLRAKQSTLTSDDLHLAQSLSRFYGDPLGYVLHAYPWGVPGPLQHYLGPDRWQGLFLHDLGVAVRERGFDGMKPVMPIRMSVASCHGSGKSTLAAWLVNWIMQTRPNAQGTITANTGDQLQNKTWASVRTWSQRSIAGHWFETNTERMYHREAQSSWFCAATTWSEDKPESFAGQHAANSTSFYIFDEASSIPKVIWETAEGGMTDGEPMFIAFGNPTRNNGKFYDTCFGLERDRWNHRNIDARDCKFTNKDQIKEWAEFYGEDSDWYRVRVLGLPPKASDAQFIDLERIRQAMKRRPAVLPGEPLVVGVDMAWGGEDSNCIRFRKGLDAYSIKPIRIPGEATRDPMVMVTRLGEVLNGDHSDGQRPAMLFMDSAGIAGPVAHRLRALGHQNIIEVNFGADSPNVKCANMRAYMWDRMKEWLLHGGIPTDPKLEVDLIGPGYKPDRNQRVLLEAKDQMRKRGVASPDNADALALTFAQNVVPRRSGTSGAIRFIRNSPWN
jgi:hypothetical protein